MSFVHQRETVDLSLPKASANHFVDFPALHASFY